MDRWIGSAAYTNREEKRTSQSEALIPGITGITLHPKVVLEVRGVLYG